MPPSQTTFASILSALAYVTDQPAIESSRRAGGSASGAAKRTGVLPRIPGAGPFLGLPLFWKIVGANVVLVAAGAAVGALFASRAGGVASGAVATEVVLVGLAVVVASVLINAWLIHVALSPLEALEETARRVGGGDAEARVPGSALADQRLGRTADVFNEMLDSVSANRTRQQELARRVLESEERERQRIAHELYSGTAQTLAGVLVRLRIAERHLTSGVIGSMNEIREEVVSALEEIRGVARRLRPPELDELGVKVALEAHGRSLSEGTRIDFSFQGDIPPLARESSLALFRIVQEAMTNAAIHSGAESVRVSFRPEGTSVVVEVVDDGHGFDLGTALAHSGQSLGLFGMHERAGYVQGELSLESGPGRGTRIRVVIPVDPEREPHPVDGTVDRLVDGLVDEIELAAPIPTQGGSAPF